MQAVEGLTILIGLADETLKLNSTYGTDAPVFSPSEERLQLATSICQAMLHTALPVAKYRVFVKIESGRENGREYTICATSIEDIVAALYPLSRMRRQVYVTLWEQRATGADMLEGYQGSSDKMRSYLDMMRKYSAAHLAN